MIDTHSILSEGLQHICRNDAAVDRLIRPRYDKICLLLAEYIKQIELYNPTLSLVGTRDPREFIIRHILDSLSPLAPLIGRNMSPCADIGSGAGLPGIPLAIVLPEIPFTLIERMNRRANFLRNTVAALGLSNVTVEEAEMEKVQRGRFSLVCFRAFRPLEPKIFKKLTRLCGEGGALAAYKGKKSKTEDEMAALEKAVPNLTGRWRLIPCPVPMLDEERHLLLIYGER